MEDLEVLCRECHEVHHSLDEIARAPRRRTIARRAICSRLTAKHRTILMAKHRGIETKNDLFIAINKPGKNSVAEDAAYLLGCYLLTDLEVSAFGSFTNTHNKKIRGF